MAFFSSELRDIESFSEWPFLSSSIYDDLENEIFQSTKNCKKKKKKYYIKDPVRLYISNEVEVQINFLLNLTVNYPAKQTEEPCVWTEEDAYRLCPGHVVFCCLSFHWIGCKEDHEI